MRGGRRLAGRQVTVAWAANDLGFPRLGMNVGKRILPRAVDRNRIRRLLRAQLRAGRAGLRGVDVVVSLRRGRDEPDWDRSAGREFALLLTRIAGSRP